MRPFTTQMYYLSERTTISAAIVIKATKYSKYFTIHNSYDVAIKYSIISTEKNVKLSYLVDSVDKNNVYFHMTCLLPKYWKLLPLSHTFIDHAVKHKKTINNNNIIIIIIFTEIYNETIDHGRVTETQVAETL